MFPLYFFHIFDCKNTKKRNIFCVSNKLIEALKGLRDFGNVVHWNACVKKTTFPTAIDLFPNLHLFQHFNRNTENISDSFQNDLDNLLFCRYYNVQTFHLQWIRTTCFLFPCAALSVLFSSISGAADRGTSWSGQAVYCNCVTVISPWEQNKYVARSLSTPGMKNNYYKTSHCKELAVYIIIVSRFA